MIYFHIQIYYQLVTAQKIRQLLNWFINKKRNILIFEIFYTICELGPSHCARIYTYRQKTVRLLKQPKSCFSYRTISITAHKICPVFLFSSKTGVRLSRYGCRYTFDAMSQRCPARMNSSALRRPSLSTSERPQIWARMFWGRPL